MELVEYLFVTPWNLMHIPITLFGYTFTLVEIYLLGFLIGIIGLAIVVFSD